MSQPRIDSSNYLPDSLCTYSAAFVVLFNCSVVSLCDLVDCNLPGFPGGLVTKESACSGGDPGSVPGLGRCPGEGSDNPLLGVCLGKLMDRGAWQDTVCGVTKESDMT